MIHAVATVYNEEHIIGQVLSHLYGEGIAHVWIADASTDTTRDYYRQYRDRLTVIHDMEPFHYQPKWINRLARLARAEGATWVVPFDADEFWYAFDGTIAEALARQPDTVGATVAPVWQHHSWTHRNEGHQDLPKIAFRPTDDTWVGNGNHHVNNVQGETVYDVLGIRELQFASLEHLHRKSRDRVERLDPDLPRTEGAHQRVLHEGGEDYRAEQWAARERRAKIEDPIPYRGQ